MTDDLPRPSFVTSFSKKIKKIKKLYGFSKKCERFFHKTNTLCELSQLTASLRLGSGASKSSPRTLVTNDFNLERLRRCYLRHMATCNVCWLRLLSYSYATYLLVTASRSGRLRPVRRSISFFLHASSWSCCEEALCCIRGGVTGNLDGEKGDAER